MRKIHTGSMVLCYFLFRGKGGVYCWLQVNLVPSHRRQGNRPFYSPVLSALAFLFLTSLLAWIPWFAREQQERLWQNKVNVSAILKQSYWIPKKGKVQSWPKGSGRGGEEREDKFFSLPPLVSPPFTLGPAPGVAISTLPNLPLS